MTDFTIWKAFYVDWQLSLQLTAVIFYVTFYANRLSSSSLGYYSTKSTYDFAPTSGGKSVPYPSAYFSCPVLACLGGD